ncbi:MAG: ABC transporter substrate-binding protein [Anaerolineae bacterium]
MRSRTIVQVAVAGVVAMGAIATLASCSAPTAGRVDFGTPLPTVEGWETEAIATLGATPVPVGIEIGLPYKPDVQFAPLYVADERGYFQELGLDPTFEYGSESTFVRLVAGREMTGMVASGEQVMLARAGEVPVTYVATWYQRFPGVVFSDDPAIAEPSDLVGRTVGLPAVSGASYTGWLALLSANGIDPTSVTTEVIGFAQLEAVTQGRVDAAVGYAANEPVQMRAAGLEPTVISIADSFNLVSNGLIVADTLAYESPSVVQAMVTAMLRGIADTLDDPESAFELALQMVPEAADPAVRDTQFQVLMESLPYWETEALGAIDPEAWQQTMDFLVAQGIVEHPTPIDEMIDSSFVDAAGPVR